MRVLGSKSPKAPGDLQLAPASKPANDLQAPKVYSSCALKSEISGEPQKSPKASKSPKSPMSRPTGLSETV